MQEKLPTAPGGSQPLPEGLLWLLLTGHLPTESQVQAVSKDLMGRSEIPPHVHAMLKSLPAGTHPMTQLSMAIMALQPDSLFARAYQDGTQLSFCYLCVASGVREHREGPVAEHVVFVPNSQR